MGRVGGDDDLKAVTLFLAAPSSGYWTGATVNIDGGWVAR
jgi:NAD(P)-dependent dehydrogenase (short-subunit alcohol dehydrogenase family)